MLRQAWLERNLSGWAKDRIVVTPFTKGNLKDGAYAFTLDPLVRRLDAGQMIDVRKKDLVSYHEVFIPSEGLVIQPGQFALFHTHERLRLPEDIACILSTHPFAARIGLDFLQTSTLVPPGSDCRLVLETVNRGPAPVKLFPGFKAVKGVFFAL